MTAKEQAAADVAKVTKIKGVVESATVVISGFAKKLQDAIDAALANGATADELQPLTDLVDATDASSDVLAAAIAANP